MVRRFKISIQGPSLDLDSLNISIYFSSIHEECSSDVVDPTTAAKWRVSAPHEVRQGRQVVIHDFNGTRSLTETLTRDLTVVKGRGVCKPLAEGMSNRLVGNLSAGWRKHADFHVNRFHVDIIEREKSMPRSGRVQGR